MGLSTVESWPVWSRCFSGAAVETFSYLIPKGFAPTRVEPYIVVYRFGETYLRVFSVGGRGQSRWKSYGEARNTTLPRLFVLRIARLRSRIKSISHRMRPGCGRDSQA